MRLPAIVNSTAGNAEPLLAALRAHGGCDVRECEGTRVARLVRNAMAQGHKRILVAGGDGTIASAAAVLAETNHELAVVPAGTLNHFARDHGIPQDVELAVALAHDGTAAPVDVARVNGRVFLNTSSAGAYVSLVDIREGLEPSLGYSLASMAAAVRVFFSVRRFAVEVTTAGRTHIYRTPLLFIGVGERELKLPALGGRVPGGRPGLHVMIVQGRTRGALLALALAAATRGVEQAGSTPHLDAFLVDACEVTLRRRTHVSADGELVHLESPLRYRLVPGGLLLVRP